MTKRYLKKCLSSLTMRDMQRETTSGFHLTQVRMQRLSTNNKCWWGGTGRNTHAFCWVCQLVQPLWKPVYRSPRKLKTNLPYGPATPPLVTFSKPRHPQIPAWPCSLMLFSQWLENGNNLKVFLLTSWYWQFDT